MSKLEGGVMSRGHYRFHDRESEQLPVCGISDEAIMCSAAFARGVADKRAGVPARYDDFIFDQADGDAVAVAKVNAHWHYERGRQFAGVAPLDKPLKIRGRLNPKALALYRAASKRGWTL